MPTPRPRHVATAKELPFFLLDPREFERLCLWLVVLENYEDAQHLGAAGSEQGRDILAYRKGKRVAIQCKRVRSFSGKDAEREIDKLLALPAGERPDEIEFIVSADISADARARAKRRADPIPCRFRALTELDLTVKKYPEVVQEFFEGGVRFGDARPRARPLGGPEPVKPSDLDEHFDVFISYNTADHDAAETLAYRLLEAGVKPFLDRWYLPAGLPWQERLLSTLERCRAVLVVLGPRGLGPWQHREQSLALDRQARDSRFPVIPLLLPEADPPLGFLRLNTWIDWRTHSPSAGDLEALVAVVRDGARETDVDIQATVSPYRSLNPFREEDAAFFFGRTAATEALATCLERQNFVAVVGDSGSGKSSLVQAGLIPRLRSSADRVWEIVALTPGDRPLQRLAAALLPLLEPGLGLVDRLRQTRKLTADLRKPEALSETVRALLGAQSGTDRLQIVVDQWEELYTQESAAQDQQDFIDQLLDATARAPLSVVMTVRGDFCGKVFAYRPLADRLRDGVVPVGPMNEDELNLAIVGPSRAAGLKLDPGLAGRIREDVSSEPGSLPLLGFVLAQLWEKRRGVRLSAEVYDTMGGVRGALAQHAETVYERLDRDEQARLPRIFGRLVRPEGKSNLRRRARLSEFAPKVHPLLWKLADQRLLTTGRDADGEETVEVPHEALLERWSRLAEWIDTDREFLLWRQRTITRHKRWIEVKRDDGILLRGAELAEAEGWLTERHGDIKHEGELIEVSSLAHARDRRRTARLRVVASAAVVLVLLLGIGWLLVERTRNAHELRRARTSAILAAAEQSSDDPTLVALFLRELKQPLEEKTTFQIARLASHAIQGPIAEQIFPGRSPLRAASFSPDGSRIVTTGRDGTVRVWSADGTGEPIVLEGHSDGVNTASFRPDSGRIVTAGKDGTARVWTVDGAEEPIVLEGHLGEVSTASFSFDGRQIVTAGHDGKARVWSADGAGEPIVLGGHSRGRLNTAFFSPDGSRIVTAGIDGTARVWGADGVGEPIVLKDRSDGVSNASFSPDGRRIVTVGFDGMARVWSLDGTGEPIGLEVGVGSVRNASFSPDGRRIVTTGSDGMVRVWRPDGTGKPIVLEGHQGRVLTASFSPDSELILSGGLDGTVRLWSANGVGEPIMLEGHPGGVHAASFSPDGRQIVTAGNDGTARVWSAGSAGEPMVLGGHSDEVGTASVSPDGRRIVTAGRDGTVRVWSTDGSEQPIVLEGHSGRVRTTAFSSDGNRIVTAGEDSTARVWSADGAGEPIVLKGHSGGVRTASFSPIGKRIVSVGGDGTVVVWSADGTGELVVLEGHSGMKKTASFSPDGSRIVIAEHFGGVRVWNEDGSGEPIVLEGRFGRSRIASFSPDGGRIVTCGSDGTARVWRADGSGEPVVLKGHSGEIQAISFSPDGGRIVTVGTDGTFRVWRADGAGEPILLKGRSGKGRTASFSPDGSQIVAVGTDGTFRVWRADGAGEPIVLKNHLGTLITASFSPDGRRIVTAGVDGTVRVWSVDAQALLGRLAVAVRGCIRPVLRVARLGETPEVASLRYESCLDLQNLRPRKPEPSDSVRP